MNEKQTYEHHQALCQPFIFVTLTLKASEGPKVNMDIGNDFPLEMLLGLFVSYFRNPGNVSLSLSLWRQESAQSL